MTEQKRRPGRPKTTGTSPQLPVRTPQALQDAAKARAEREGTTLSAVVNRLLAEYIRERHL